MSSTLIAPSQFGFEVITRIRIILYVCTVCIRHLYVITSSLKDEPSNPKEYACV